MTFLVTSSLFFPDLFAMALFFRVISFNFIFSLGLFLFQAKQQSLYFELKCLSCPSLPALPLQ